jgi:geranylgeranyl reductase family protein
MIVSEADVVVVGAGPAGVAAAVTLARRGAAVVVLDKARFPRDKICGDGLTTNALRRLQALGVDPVAVRSWQPIRQAIVRVPDGRQATFRLPDGGLYAAAARRLDLDAELVRAARRAGATVLEEASVRGVELEAGGETVAVTAEGGCRVRGRYVIAADGMWSPLRKHLGLDQGYLGGWHAIRQYVGGAGPAAATMWVWFEADLVPGYAWSFPLPSGAVNVGFGVHREPGQPIGPVKTRWEEIRSRPHIRAVLGDGAVEEGPLRSWPIPTGIGTAELSGLGGRVLFAGDAARAADSMTGEGIAQALETGSEAAEALVTAGPDDPRTAAALYRRRIDRGMAVDDRLSRALSKVLARPRGASGWLRVASATPAVAAHFSRWMFEDYPRAVFATPRRWARGSLARPGAWAEGTPG